MHGLRGIGMAVYMFTFHAYGTWLPDRGRGYVKRGQGVLPTDLDEAGRYRGRMREDPVEFGPDIQRVIVEAVQLLCGRKPWRLHQVMTDATHVHILMSWHRFHEWPKVRRSLRYALTSALNAAFASRQWFSEAGSRKHVRDRQHFVYLMDEYLPKHDGVYWRDDGKTREACRKASRRKSGDQNRRL